MESVMPIKDGSNLGQATAFAHKARTGKAGDFSGGKPNAGPKPAGWKLNGVRPPKESGVSKK
jgi:hypothetical protein